jgi:hypothetical protein
LKDGWSVPEWWGVWAVGQSATLRINRRNLAREPPIARLRLQLTAFVAPQHPEQHVAIRVDGVEVQKLHFHYPNATELQANIPLNAIRLKGPGSITIEFLMPQAVSPASIGLSAETRVIGIGLKSLELVGDTHAQ